LETLCSWSKNEEKTKRLLPLNLLDQIGVFKLGELLENPEEGNQQPSVENDINVSTKVQRLVSEESTDNLTTSAQQLEIVDDIV